MRLRFTFRFQQVGDTWLGSAVGQNAPLFNGVLQLNEVGYFIVSKLAELPDKQESELVIYLTDCLTNEYAVDRSTAQSAVISVLDYLKAEQVLE